MSFCHSGHYFKEKYNLLSNENQTCPFENEKNATEQLTNDNQVKIKDLEHKINQLSERLAETIDKANDLKKQNKKILKKCNNTKKQYEIFQSTKNIVISSIADNENGLEIDVCLGISTGIGYFTSTTCCDADEIFLFDIESSNEIVFDQNSISVEEHICFINITKLESIDFQDSNIGGPQNCSIVNYDDSTAEFENHFDIFELQKCFNSPCLIDIDPFGLQNKSILNGTSVICTESGQFGIVTKS